MSKSFAERVKPEVAEAAAAAAAAAKVGRNSTMKDESERFNLAFCHEKSVSVSSLEFSKQSLGQEIWDRPWVLNDVRFDSAIRQVNVNINKVGRLCYVVMGTGID